MSLNCVFISVQYVNQHYTKHYFDRQTYAMFLFLFIDNYHAFNTQYYPIGQVAQRVKLEPALVARITSSLLCEKGSHEK